MRRLLFLFAVLFVLPLLGSDSPKEYDDRATRNDLEGRWELVEHHYKGVKQELLPHSTMLTFHSTTSDFELGRGDSWPGPWRGIYRSDATCHPAQLDWTLKAWKLTLKQIYRVDGDTLKVARNPDDFDKRPQGFGDKDLEIETYRRVRSGTLSHTSAGIFAEAAVAKAK